MLALIQIAAQSPPPGYVEIIWWDYLKILLVLGLMVAGAWAFLRYVSPRMSAMNQAAGPIRVLARYPLEQRKTLYVVKVGDETLLIGASDNAIELLKTLPPGTFPEQAVDPAARPPSTFLKTLSQLQRK